MRKKSPPSNLRMFWTLEETAERFGLSPRTVRRLIEQGQLPVHRIGRAVRISDDDLRRFTAGTRAAWPLASPRDR